MFDFSLTSFESNRDKIDIHEELSLYEEVVNIQEFLNKVTNLHNVIKILLEFYKEATMITISDLPINLLTSLICRNYKLNS